VTRGQRLVWLVFSIITAPLALVGVVTNKYLWIKAACKLLVTTPTTA